MGIGTTGLAIAGLGASALSAGVGAVGAISSSQAQSRNASYQAHVAANNATVANQNATLATEQAGAKVQSDYRASALKIGAQRAALGANGGTLDTGSAASVQSNTAEYGQLAANNDAYQGDLTSYGLRTQAGNFTAQSGLDTAAAGNASTAGIFSASGSLLSGASQFASKWNSYMTPATPTTPAAGAP